MTEITLTIKAQAGGAEFQVTLPQESTIAQLKDALVGKTEIAR